MTREEAIKLAAKKAADAYDKDQLSNKLKEKTNAKWFHIFDDFISAEIPSLEALQIVREEYPPEEKPLPIESATNKYDNASPFLFVINNGVRETHRIRVTWKCKDKTVYCKLPIKVYEAVIGGALSVKYSDSEVLAYTTMRTPKNIRKQAYYLKPNPCKKITFYGENYYYACPPGFEEQYENLCFKAELCIISKLQQ